MIGQEKQIGSLYLVSTPIGNLEDLSARARRLLRDVDWVAAEDTRETRKLLESQGISRELLSLHEHSGPGRSAALAERLSRGESGAYVSDAGSPGLCDPGAELVNAAAAIGATIVPVPGPSAPVALLSVSGFSASEFSFRGFFPRDRAGREEWAEAAAAAGGIQVFFEAPHRIRECLSFLASHFSESSLVVGRELTKRFETITRGSASEVAEKLGSEEPRGEYVLALDLGAPRKKPEGLALPELNSLLADLADLGAGNRVLVRVAMSHGLPKNRAYEAALAALKPHS